MSAPDYSDEEAQILARRAYPDGPSGLCSRLHPVGDEAECTVCFPDLWALIHAHNNLKQEAWARLSALGERVPPLSRNRGDES